MEVEKISRLYQINMLTICLCDSIIMYHIKIVHGGLLITGAYKQWHPAFYSAMKLELSGNKGELVYNIATCLNTKPLQIDLLIIMNNNDVNITNEIGRIFRKHNILEYKSPEDELNIDTFFKAIGYSCLYKASGDSVDEIKLEDVTISYIRQRKPKKLFGQLRKRGYEIENTGRGIYYIRCGSFFLIQFVVTNELDKSEHLWLTSLNVGMDSNSVDNFIFKMNSLKDKDDKENADSVLQIVMSNNEELFKNKKEESGVMCEALRELFKDEIEEMEINIEEMERNMGEMERNMGEMEKNMGEMEKNMGEMEKELQLKEEENRILRKRIAELSGTEC